jgi:ATP adenylyltransferase
MSAKDENTLLGGSTHRLWAPWRLEYIKNTAGKKLSECPFCILPKESNDEENLILFKDQDLFVILNRFPYNPNHLMIIPREHVADPLSLAPSLWSKLARAQQAALLNLKAAVNPQGFNMGMNLGIHGGAGIAEHLHWHIVPRWQGDTNFMPLIGETKALPTHNQTIYAGLKAHFADFAKQLEQMATQDKI